MNTQKIFFSYSHANKGIVWEIADRLDKIYSIWIDRDYLIGGVKLDKEIADGVRNSSLFICFISEEYCESDACNEEFALAKKLKKKMLPVMLKREASNGLELTIAKLNTFYAFKPPNVFNPWCEDLFLKLLNNIKDLIQVNVSTNDLNKLNKTNIVQKSKETEQDKNIELKDIPNNQANIEDEINILNLNGNQNSQDIQAISGKCGEYLIGINNGLKATGQFSHAKCFNCVACNISIKNESFYELKKKTYCEACYLKSLERCSVCSNPIIIDRILRAIGKTYHSECFCCEVCKNNLDGIEFTVDSSNKIHCLACFQNKYASRCHKCRLPITPDIGQEETTKIVALDKSFHIDCYKCEDCGVTLSVKHGDDLAPCYPLDGHFYCKNCNIKRSRSSKDKSTQE